MKAIDFLKEFPYVPVTLSRGKGKTWYDRPSNSELKRWLMNGSVLINGENPKPWDEVEYPINQLIFFPKKNRCTIYD